MRVLVVEDDLKLGSLLSDVLESEGYSVLFATSAADARDVSAPSVDLAVVDWMLPDGDGLEVAMDLRRRRFDGPILVLTARTAIKDRVHALDRGADDYLAKPFAIEELLARLRALARRGSPSDVQIEGLRIDVAQRRAYAGDRALDLTVRELDLLLYLGRRAGQTVSRAELIENVWDAIEVVPNVIEVHISRLRDKLGEHAELIETVRGVGYRVRAPGAS